MIQFGYHASHEQFSPRNLLKYARLAEQAGFSAITCSDHFHPWSDRQGEMFPDRFWIAVGSGQALNEAITGTPFPIKADRHLRLHECAQVMRALWAGKTVTHRGLVRVEEAKLYTRPANPPQLIGAAITPKTAEWLGSWADGLITISHPYDKLKQVVEAFRRGGGENKPMYLKVQLSYDRNRETALQGAYDQWRTNIFTSPVLAELRHPHQFDAAAEFVKPEDMYEYVRISADPEQHIDWLQKDIELGFQTISLHNVNREQQQFIETFGEKVLPVVSKL
jgi:G6PDH family F420-dependent oxidoreductase